MIHHILIQVKKPLMLMRGMRYVVVDGRASFLDLMTLLGNLFSNLA